jgi:hypothetical protein
MTAQVGESLLYNGDERSMCCEPLTQFFDLGGKKPDFGTTSTACWRGYFGKWEVCDQRLYLIGIEARLADGTSVGLETMFPGFPERVFAHWFTGAVRIPEGELLEYVHGGYASVNERDLLLTFEHGFLQHTSLRENQTLVRRTWNRLIAKRLPGSGQ